MTQKTHPLDTKPDPIQSTLTQEQTKLKQKSEEKEVAGKHKNDGQKDHKGAR